MCAEVIEPQFESMQSLAEQWRIQLAALGGSSGTSLSSVEESKPTVSDSMHADLSRFNSSVSLTSPHDKASENLELESLKKVYLLIFWTLCVTLNLQHWGTS